MGDLFDEFMRELERRRAEAEGRAPRSKPEDDRRAGDQDGDEDGDPDADPDADRRAAGAGGRAAADADDRAADADADADAPTGGRARKDDAAGDDDTDDVPDNEPVPLRPRRGPGGSRSRTGGAGAAGAGAGATGAGAGSTGGGGGRGSKGPGGKGPGGPNDGAKPLTLGGILRRMGVAAVGIVILAIIFLGSVGIDLWTDVIWYDSVGYESVLWTRLGAQVGLFAAGLVLALVVLLGNLWLAGRLVPPANPDKPGLLRSWQDRIADAQRRAEHNARLGGTGPYAGNRRDNGPAIVFEADEIPDLVPIGTWVLVVFGALIAVGIAGAVSGAWETLLLWVNRVPFSPTGTVADPVFGRDISFFLFEMPFFRFVQSLLNGLLLASLAVVGARYLLATTQGGEVFVTRVRVHLAVLAGLYLLSVAFGYQFDKYELVYSGQGVATGVSFTDANARFFAYDVLTFLSGIAGALLIAGAFTRWLWPLGAVVVVWFAASLLLGRLYPEAIQRFTVEPNKYAQEEQYIANNIAMTRLAFDIDDWERRSFRGEAPLTQEAIDEEKNTFANARLWDYRPLQATLDQLQTVRQYYDFLDVDTDRYVINDELRQVMLSGRELALEKNPQATGWVNERIIYTHGIGVAMVPVNEVTNEGQPRLWIRDLPPVSSSGAPEITEPRIYFGERPNGYVVVGARQAEFDFPRDNGTGEEPVETRFSADTGISLGSTLDRLLFALRFRDLNLLISDQITADSQLLFHRSIDDRLPRIAPFLLYDKDPYLVINDAGELVYVQDAYTASDRFPHATWFDPDQLGETGLGRQPFNYLRNSVKITMNAYDGRMTFYVADDADPLIRAWQGIFPELFRPLSELGGGLEDNLRTPEEGFNVQTRMFGRYHVTQTLAFFNGTDLWTVPQGQTNEQVLPSEAYYVVMRMPGEDEAEFLLLQPMIPASRPNMIAWVAARNDPDTRGQVRYYQFPAETTVFGPAQIEARIDQDPIISSQVTLWSQAGSSVIRGNLIVVPVGEDSLLYIQPVYLQSTSAAFPEFQKIIVASPTTVVWGDTLGEAISTLLERQGGSPTPTPTPNPSPGASPTPGPSGTPGPTTPPDSGLPTDVAGLVDYANTHFELAQAALRAGDFATYGEEMEKVEAALRALGPLTEGSPQP